MARFCNLLFAVPSGLMMLVGTDIIIWFESSTLLLNDLRAFSVARNELVYTINQGQRRGQCRSTEGGHTTPNAEVECGINKTVRRRDEL
jgi:hypothetical protein